jgi:hypothetical protein
MEAAYKLKGMFFSYGSYHVILTEQSTWCSGWLW